MKLVAISIVKNEVDIIEALARHTRTWVDHHLLFDHDSTDGTREILVALVREGLPLTIYHGSAVSKSQQSRSNHLAQIAFETHGADWVLPLDADEFIVAVNRANLETQLAAGPNDQPVHLPLRNYVPTTADDANEPNPVHRLRHRQRGKERTMKVFIPRALGARHDVTVGSGNHTVLEGGQPIPSRALPDAWLAHFPLRSPYQEVLRVVTAELQRLSRGQSHAGLDTHYRLGFQTIAEDPAQFFSTVQQSPERFVYDPAPYLGDALRHGAGITDVGRVARALLPFLEQLARSHGRLVDQAGATAERDDEKIEPLDLASVPMPRPANEARFSGFVPLSGWQKQEGPVPSAFLPVFHWTTAPETALSIHAETDRLARLHAEVLTYAERQVTTVVLNGVELLRHVFTQVNQKEILSLPLQLHAGENRLVFRHRAWLHSTVDPRKLALIFLSLRVL